MPVVRALVLLLILLAPAVHAEEPLRVFAAISLKGSVDKVSRQFETATGNKVVISFAASPALARQIEAGAPADVFISADTDWADYLAGKNLLRAGTRVNVLTNQLVLIAEKDNATTLRIQPGFALASALGKHRLALAPEAVPVGRYAKAALESLGLWRSVADRTVRAENARAVLALVARGEAPWGIVYRSDALTDANIRIVDTFPAPSHPRILYGAGVVATSKAQQAAAFLKYLTSPAARLLWEQDGFGIAP
jgi:molybdate transport system substrate-binding protein